VAWFESIVGPEYAPAVMWTAVALGLLIVLLIVLRLLRGFSSGTFVMGGRNRKARLAVMDATAVDANRRLVLVRRDDVEHLILIGGPTDVVVEQNIRPATAARRPADMEPALAVAPTPIATPRSQRGDHDVQVPPPPQAATRAPSNPAQAQPVQRAPVPEIERSASASSMTRSEPPLEDRPAHRAPPVVHAKQDKDEIALENEMNRLLGDISTEPRR